MLQLTLWPWLVAKQRKGNSLKPEGPLLSAQLTLDVLSDSQLVEKLRAICSRWAAGESSSQQLDLPAVAIGREIYRRGGINAMRQAFVTLGEILGKRALEMTWDGIGEWLG